VGSRRPGDEQRPGLPAGAASRSGDLTEQRLRNLEGELLRAKLDRSDRWLLLLGGLVMGVSLAGLAASFRAESTARQMTRRWTPPWIGSERKD
jgi:hypothetical protein